MAEDERLRRQEKLTEDERPPDEERLRRYLLGLSLPEESAGIERTILAEFHPILDIIEDELIEDYVTDELSEPERSRFEERFLFSQERVERIRLSAMLLGRPDVAETLSRRVADLQQKLALEAVLKDALGEMSEGGPQFHSFDHTHVAPLRAGDFPTQEHFMAYFGQSIQLKLRSRLHSPQAIEDAGQKIFAQFYAALREGQIVHPERLGSFVNLICDNVLNVLLKRELVSSRSSPLKDDGGQAVPIIFSEVMGASQAEEEKIREILNQLPENDRRLLREVFLKGRDKEDVCRELGVDRNYLRVLLHRLKQEFTGSESQRADRLAKKKDKA